MNNLTMVNRNESPMKLQSFRKKLGQ